MVNWEQLSYLLNEFGPEMNEVLRVWSEAGKGKHATDGDEAYRHKTLEFHQAKSLKHKSQWMLHEPIDGDSRCHAQAHVILREIMSFKKINQRKDHETT